MVKVTNRLALSRDLVIRSAISYVDENGLPALTMRRLGHSLGVEAMSLYRYVNGREDLLESMVEHLVQSLRLTPGQAEALGDWPAYLNWLANAVRSIAVDHPQVFPLIATRHPSAPWLRPPLRSLDVVEDFLRILTSSGFSDERAVAAYRAFSSFLLGHLLLEATQRSPEPTLAEEQMDTEADDDDPKVSEYPLIMRMSKKLAQDRAQEEFDVSLENTLDRLAAGAD
jgi:AcrR family transcriptional regulator